MITTPSLKTRMWLFLLLLLLLLLEYPYTIFKKIQEKQSQTNQRRQN
jgi:hypothetical protein